MLSRLLDFTTIEDNCWMILCKDEVKIHKQKQTNRSKTIQSKNVVFN